jgi:hypothetical protein
VGASAPWDPFVRLEPKPLLAAIALLLALCLAACGEGQTSSSRGGAQSSPTPKAHESGEKSIEEFGQEAEGQERAAILDSFHSYLGAIVARDYPGACARLATAVKRSLAALASQSQAKGCAATLPKLLSRSAPQTARQQAEGEVTKVRFEGNRGFVVFHAPGAKLFEQTMARENGEWKVATVAASVLVPQL